ncbi:fimbria/pilus outer membrane usher protein [Psychrobacter sanguinis]|uniref:fimbria/pilus outer membrane usher protein n=1 Tax=Psychrobacter sanguinis TaxID=861445 RepID=UPI00191A841E|nr:fimbria/pilus outer membrane usher protein [Psychrobacter sanguinis]MCC3345096.1 fimbrial biogenesis outer membrane usher protein [Psychrobacter sanguinis]
MDKVRIIKTPIKHTFSYSLLCGIVTLSLSGLAVAEVDIDNQNSTAVSADFNSDFLIGDAKKIDITKFANGNPILPGEYSLDVYVNGTWFGKQRLVFKSTPDEKSSFTCFTPKQLLEYGIKAELIKQKAKNSANSCLPLEQWVDEAFYNFDISSLKLEVSIPQVAMQNNARGYVDPSIWDRGINAGFTSYNASAYKTFDNVRNQENTNAFVSINAGLNLAGWQLRHNGQWTWSDNEDSKSEYTAVNTYLQRAFPEQRGVLTLGDSFSQGDIFDTFGYRGVAFASDDRMLPSSLSGYAPRIRGNAKTNAKVEVRQQGQLIYQTNVSAGSFEINDLYPTGFGGQLEVSVIEADGEVQKFSLPYTSVAQMLRPGLSRYAVVAGSYRNKEIDKDPLILQGQYQRGINNFITAYGGAQASEDYKAVTLGSAFATRLGAVAFDVTHSDTDFKNRNPETGQSYRISYSKLIGPTNTNVTLAAYRYSTQGFYRLADAFRARKQDEEGIGSLYIGKQRSEFQVTLNQGLPNDWGNFYLTGAWVDYWDKQEDTKQYQFGYNNTYKGVSYGLSANKRVVENANSGRVIDDTEYMLTLSLPLSIKRNAVTLNSYATQDNITVGINGSLGNRASYGATLSTDYGENPSLNANAQYRSNYTTLGGTYSVADGYQQLGLSAGGNIVVHPSGVVFSPDQGRTMVLVHAPGAEGARVNSIDGITVNKSGYAVIPYVSPYRINDVSLDTVGMSEDVELEGASQRVVPYEGSVTKLDFSTKVGKAIYINTVDDKGNTLPFGADVIDSNNEHIGIVAQGSLVYLRTPKLSDTITVKWGDEQNEQCQMSYDITNLAKDKTQQMINLEEGVCHGF